MSDWTEYCGQHVSLTPELLLERWREQAKQLEMNPPGSDRSLKRMAEALERLEKKHARPPA